MSGGGLRITASGGFQDSKGTYNSSGRPTSGGSSSSSSSSSSGGKVSYADLATKKINGNTTVYNTKTGKEYSSEAQLKADLGSSSINWAGIRAGGSTPPTPAPGGDSLQSIADIYAKRPDLQGLYGTDGRAINPNDPRVKNIPTILDWAEQFGAKEYSQLQGYSKQPAAPPVPGVEGQFPTTGDPKLDAILAEMQKKVNDAQANGQMINPNIELTPAEIKKFLDQATSEIDPYYASQIAAIRKNLDMSLDELQKSYDLQKQQNEADFKANLGVQQEQLADTGLAFSGARKQRENALVSDQNRMLEDKAASASSKAASAILDTETKIGSRNLANLQMPNLVQYEASTENGGRLKNKRSLNFGTRGGQTGDVEYNRNRDIRSLSDYLQSKEIQRKTLNF